VVESTLSYLADLAERPYFYLYEPPPETPWRNTKGDRRRVAIHDARDLVPPPSLDVEGFLLASHETAVGNLYDPNAVRDVYYREIAELVRKLTGATRVVAFDHNVRSASKAQRGEKGVQPPVRFPHNDYTERSGPQRVRDLFRADEAERLLANRFVVINVWKPIRGRVEDAGPGGGGLFPPLQPRPPLVLLLAHAGGRGDAPQVLRLRPWPCAVHRPHGIRRPDESTQSPAP